MSFLHAKLLYGSIKHIAHVSTGLLLWCLNNAGSISIFYKCFMLGQSQICNWSESALFAKSFFVLSWSSGYTYIIQE